MQPLKSIDLSVNSRG